MENTVNYAKKIRKNIFRIAYSSGGGHLAGALSMADLIAVIYFGDVLRYDALNPKWEDRDFFILSKGHASYALYSALQMAGFFTEKELWNVGRPGSSFGEHPKLNDIPGVEASTGALGHGLSFSIGIAYANKVDNKKSHVYTILGDGECQEGSIWEGALSAPTLKLDNLTVIVDHNKLQAMDKLENIVNMKPFADKWRTFGWHVVEIDGHDHKEIRNSLLLREEVKPVLVIANTIKGKGVSFMENKPIWHCRMPNEEELPILMKELEISKEELIH